ncbi:MAG: chloride channel protein [Clostridia bacterium]|nr:chloride channel protein [Clostridia bacterium]
MEYIKKPLEYLKRLIQWTVVAVVAGLLGGLVGSVFHHCVDYVTELRLNNPWILLFLPVAGILIAGMYRIFKKEGILDTNCVLEGVQSDKKIPFVMLPLIFVSTVLTHLVGGSVGREGAALQLGGSIGYRLGRWMRLKKETLHIIVMAGMSSVFSALFGTPLTATVFSMEVASVGVIHYAALLPCVVASVVAYEISLLMGIAPIRFANVVFEPVTATLMGKVVLLALLCAWVSILFCSVIHNCERCMKKRMPNPWVRGAIGGGVILLLTALVGNQDYNGAGMDVIVHAVSGDARYEAFLLKIVFTAITIGAGFKGGEIVPTFFIGATFGCVAGNFLGMDAGFGAAIGLVTLFCCVVNCPLASLLLAVELFGIQGILFFAVACGVGYLMSGNRSLYHAQKIIYSKLDDTYLDEYAK